MQIILFAIIMQTILLYYIVFHYNKFVYFDNSFVDKPVEYYRTAK